MKKLYDWLMGLSDARFLQIYIPFMLSLIGIIFICGEAIVSRNIEGLWLNLGTEILGAGGMYFLLTLVLGYWEKKEEEKVARAELRARLIREMGSGVPEIATRAVEELRASQHEWLTDGSLHNAELVKANLQEMWLAHADLQGARLDSANLRGARLLGANLRDVWLINVDLQGAWLVSTQLQGANLRGANLQEADLQNAEYDERTILPDNIRWKPDTNMAYFTDPDHPDGFWRSDDPASPAYQSRVR